MIGIVSEYEREEKTGIKDIFHSILSSVSNRIYLFCDITSFFSVFFQSIFGDNLFCTQDRPFREGNEISYFSCLSRGIFFGGCEHITSVEKVFEKSIYLRFQ